MLPEDRLDALLSPRGTLPQPYAGQNDNDATFAPLLAAAAQLAVLADARPSASFSQALETRFLAHAVTLADAGRATHPGYSRQLSPNSDHPTLPAAYTYAGAPTSAPERSRATHSSRPRDMQPQRGLAHLRSRYQRLLPQAIAASLILLLGIGALTAAAAAGPGSFLFPLHRLEQGVQLGLSGSAADRFRLHLGYANDALATLDAAHGESHGKSTYAQALATLSDELRATEKELAAVPSGTEHDDLTNQLQAFKTRATHDLYAVVGSSATLSWQNRVATTQVLGQLGAQVPHIDSAHISRADSTNLSGDSGSRDTHSWQVTISGSGFTPGAVITVNGHAVGTVIKLTPTQIVALIKVDDAGIAVGTLGIKEPDGTAAQANDSAAGDDGHSGSSNATMTPSPRSGDSHSGDGHGGKPGDQTPIPTITPSPKSGQP